MNYITIPVPHFARWAVLPIIAVALALSLTWGGGATAQEGREVAGRLGGGGTGQAAAGPFVDFDLFVPGADLDGDTVFDDCVTAIEDKKCAISPGSAFPVVVDLTKNTGFLFNRYFIHLTYSGGLTRIDTADECAVGPFPGSILEADETTTGTQKVYIMDCDDSTSPLISYVGPLAILDFVCPPFKSKETITIQYGEGYGGNTQILDTLLDVFASEKTLESGFTHTQTIIINCDNFYPWDINLDGIVDLPNDILSVILHFCPLVADPCSKPYLDGGDGPNGNGGGD